MLGVAEIVPVGSWAKPAASEPTEKAIVLYCDLAVDPAREQEMLHHFHHDFKPAAAKFEGFIDLKMLKLRKVVQGRPAPAPGINYRFQLTYRSEELRDRWIASDVHKKYWPMIEDTVTNKDYLVLLTDNA
jgi:hypothetical protein